MVTEINQPKENMQMQGTALLDENKSLKVEVAKLKMEKQSLITALSLVNCELVKAKRLASIAGHNTKESYQKISDEPSSTLNKNSGNEQKYKSRSIFVLDDSIIKNLNG